MTLNATLNNISAISWRSVLLLEDTEKTTDLSQVTDKLYHIRSSSDARVFSPMKNEQNTHGYMTVWYTKGIDLLITSALIPTCLVESALNPTCLLQVSDFSTHLYLGSGPLLLGRLARKWYTKGI
jgi:hypothetical protein